MVSWTSDDRALSHMSFCKGDCETPQYCLCLCAANSILTVYIYIVGYWLLEAVIRLRPQLVANLESSHLSSSLIY